MKDKKAVSILITAGGTQEHIDTVRSITNHATGRLGSLIADTFLQNGAEVTFLCGESSQLPKEWGFKLVKIRDVAGIMEALDTLLKEKDFDCVIHSMAVSDFTPQVITSLGEMASAIGRELSGGNFSGDEIYERIQKAIINLEAKPAVKKIDSKSAMVMVLKQTPKVIDHIKKVQPQTLLVGFKLLSGVTEAELIEAGHKLMDHSGCDFVLANDLKDISEDAHKAVLMDGQGIIGRADGKQEIADVIYGRVMERM